MSYDVVERYLSQEQKKSETRSDYFYFREKNRDGKTIEMNPRQKT